MNKLELLRELESVLMLDPETLEIGNKLTEIKNWDSMASLGYIALLDSEFGVQINGDQLQACQTVSDLLDLAPVSE